MSFRKIKLSAYVELISGSDSCTWMAKFFPGGENFWAELGRAWGGGDPWVNSMIFEWNLKRKNFYKLYM